MPRVASRKMLPDTVVASPEMLPMSVCHHVAFQPGRRYGQEDDSYRAGRTRRGDSPRYRSATGKQKRKILDEFVASTGYHEKSAIRVLNGQPITKAARHATVPSLYDEAARGALIVLWEASDRVCGKRLKALLPILLPALERNGHLKLDETIRAKILAMSAATIDRLLRAPRAVTRSKKRSPDRARAAPAHTVTHLCGLE